MTQQMYGTTFDAASFSGVHELAVSEGIKFENMDRLKDTYTHMYILIYITAILLKYLL